jgi:hypothetical protein
MKLFLLLLGRDRRRSGDKASRVTSFLPSSQSPARLRSPWVVGVPVCNLPVVKKTGTPKPLISPFMPGFSGNTGSNLTQQSAIQSPVIAISVALDLLRFKGFG